ncbi:hypothetical protein [Streptomyces spectabilis]|uniref:hypothetical protein n=1 Tax=Streptomyces spectabilis TaxID=68270 RepID=UPI001864D735|nr:hypothetical protein [Streptomyces spectabilis]
MHSGPHGTGGPPPAFLAPEASSFVDFLAAHAPDALPAHRALPAPHDGFEAPHGTTIVAAAYAAAHRKLAQDEVAAVARSVVDGRLEASNGPRAPVL